MQGSVELLTLLFPTSSINFLIHGTMQDCIYHMTLKLHFDGKFVLKANLSAICKRDIVMDVIA